MPTLAELQNLEGKNLLVLGGAGYLGKAASEVFAELGGNVIISSRSKNKCNEIGLKNVVFEDEISSSQIFDLYSKCLLGLIVLDKKHKTHNIPGKLLSYLRAGLPVFAIVNEKNDLIKLVNENHVGFATDKFDMHEIHINFMNLLNNIEKDQEIKARCKKLSNKLFSTSKIVKEIINDLK